MNWKDNPSFMVVAREKWTMTMTVALASSNNDCPDEHRTMAARYQGWRAMGQKAVEMCEHPSKFPVGGLYVDGYNAACVKNAKRIRALFAQENEDTPTTPETAPETTQDPGPRATPSEPEAPRESQGASEPKSIDHRDCEHWMEAWAWAQSAATLGWRVVSISYDRSHWHVFVETPEGSDSDDWQFTGPMTKGLSDKESP